MLKASVLTGCCRARQVQPICCVTGGVSTSCRSLEITQCPARCSGDISKYLPLAGWRLSCPWNQSSCHAWLGGTWWRIPSVLNGFMGYAITTAEPLVSGREMGRCFTDLLSDIVGPVMPPGASPPRASRWAPKSQGRCWLWDMKLFALHGAGFDPLSHLLQLMLPVPVWHSQAWAKRQHCGLRVMGHCPLGTPCSAGGGGCHCREGRSCPTAVLA